jgi:two-component system response regulator CpxR
MARKGYIASAGMRVEKMAKEAANEKRMLLIEDDVDLCALMTDFFSQHNFRAEAAHDGTTGLARALEGGFDIILLDVMIPVLDGFDVLRALRQRSATPVIMLTARTEREDRIGGLDLGADDYLPKPFEPGELLARIRAVLRRSGHIEQRDEKFKRGALSVDPALRKATINGEPVELTSIEFDILLLLARAAGRIVSRDEISAALHQREATPFERSLDVHISHLRKKLSRGEENPIRTIRGVGYMLGPVSGDAA